MIDARGMGYRYIGSGSSRRVFDLENGYVMKVARNKAGIAQNKTEYKIALIDSSNLFAEVVKVSEDFNVLIMKKADKINDFSIILDYFNVRNIKELSKVKELQKIQYKYNLLWGDLRRISSWGIIDGIPKIIDYGFTREVRKKYY